MTILSKNDLALKSKLSRTVELKPRGSLFICLKRKNILRAFKNSSKVKTIRGKLSKVRGKLKY